MVRMTKSECRMPNQIRMTNCRASVSDAMAFRRMEPAGAERHRRAGRRPSERERASQTPYNDSCLVIFDSAFIQRADDHLLFRRNFLPDKHQFGAIEFKWLQFPAARHEIEKLRAISEADETLRANHASRQAICKAFERIARTNFAGSECERFEFRLMPVFRRCDFS